MRLTTLFVLFVCTSLIIVSDLATAQKALTGPIASESELVTSRVSAAGGVPEARGSFSFSAFFEWLAKIFKSSRLKQLEEKLVPVKSHQDKILYEDIKAKIADLEPYLHNSFLLLDKDFESNKLVELNYYACEIFKSHEFRAVYQKLRSLEGVDEDAAMYNFLYHQFGQKQTAQLLWVGAVSGRGDPKTWARLVEKAQYRIWMGDKIIFNPEHVATYLGLESQHLIGDGKSILNTIATRYWKSIGDDYLRPAATSAK
uniref:RxLR effector candidate protein n=1 Tax=Hyaloperonospora arabidopsidis (strain Emoy2) TaxID=559515 RepID=M4BK69_HYAAE